MILTVISLVVFGKKIYRNSDTLNKDKISILNRNQIKNPKKIIFIKDSFDISTSIYHYTFLNKEINIYPSLSVLTFFLSLTLSSIYLSM